MCVAGSPSGSTEAEGDVQPMRKASVVARARTNRGSLPARQRVGYSFIYMYVYIHVGGYHVMLVLARCVGIIVCSRVLKGSRLLISVQGIASL